jgi:hypothetical protein
MSINAKQLREYVIRPTLKEMELWSEEAEDLLMGTAAQESHLGTYIHQLGGGPALGIYQMEPNTHNDILNNYLSYREELLEDVEQYCTGVDLNRDLMCSLHYATAMARVHYLRVPESLPSKSDLSPKEYIVQLASYWKSYYNTPLGAGTMEEFMENYLKYVVE